MSINDAIDPTTGEITDYDCIIYYKLLDVLTNLDSMNTKLDTVIIKLDDLGAQINAGIPQSSLLVSEYYGNQDMDGNGLIYGVDFYISSSDIPQSLKIIPKKGAPMTWNDYLGSIA